MSKSGGGATTTTRLIRAEDGGSGGGDDVNVEVNNRERPKEPWGGEIAKSIVYAGLDAIITCFSLISSISASHHSSGDVLVLGLANLVADAMSMGLGDYVSSRTEQDVIAERRLVTEWDIINHRGTEQVYLIQHYQSLGMDINDATTVVSIFAKYKDMLVDQKMVADRGMLPAAEEEAKPWKNGLVTFASFNVFGFTSLLSFIILIPFTDSDSVKFIGACIVSALALGVLGIAKAKITSQNYMFSAAVTVFNGAAAATAAYTLGWVLKHVAGLEE